MNMKCSQLIFKNFVRIKGVVIIFVFCFCTSVSAQYRGYTLEDGKEKVSFPFEIHNNLIVIPVIFNDVLKVNFILDSGVRTGIIFEKFITDYLGVDYTRRISIMGAGEEKIVEAVVASNLTVGLPGVKAYGQSMLVLMEDYLELEKQLGYPVHGIIGYEIFSRFVVDIDYSDKVITLYEPEHYKPSNWRKSLPIDIIDTKPYLTAPIWMDDTTKVEGKFLLDTGASHALVLHKDSDEKIYLPSKNIESILGKGLTGIITGHLARIKKMKLAKYELDDIVVSFPDENSYSDSLLVEERNGTIGGEILKKFDIAFDYFNERIYFRRNGYFRDSFEYNMSGIDLQGVGPEYNTITVAAVRKNSVGEEEGIHKGDTVVAINGYYGKSLTLKRAYALFNSKDGKNIRMIIKKDGERVKKKFELKKEI